MTETAVPLAIAGICVVGAVVLGGLLCGWLGSRRRLGPFNVDRGEVHELVECEKDGSVIAQRQPDVLFRESPQFVGELDDDAGGALDHRRGRGRDAPA